MTAITVDQAVENVYTSLHEGNRDIDTHVRALKEALATAGKKEALFDAKRLSQNNRQGRKLMQSYFKQRGVIVTFAE